MANTYYKSLAFKEFSNDIGEKEKLILQKWRNDNKVNENLYYHWLEDYHIEHSSQKFKDSSADEFLKLKERIVQHDNESRKASKSRQLYVYLKVAAVMLILLSVGVGYNLLFTSENLLLTTGPNEEKEFTLPDGSTVFLEENTTLSYGSSWYSDDREVELKGVAFFDVVKSKTGKKFFVKSRKVFVEVLGTEFKVDGRTPKVAVSLFEGSVQLKLDKSAPAEILMIPGDKVVYFADENRFDKSLIDKPSIEKLNNQYVFESTKISKLIEIIEKDFAYSVHVQDSLILNKKLSGSLPANNLDILLEVMEKSFDLDIDVINDSISIKK